MTQKVHVTIETTRPIADTSIVRIYDDRLHPVAKVYRIEKMLTDDGKTQWSVYDEDGPIVQGFASFHQAVIICFQRWYGSRADL